MSLRSRIWPGSPYPLGATYDGVGVNFAVFSEEGHRVELCLFDSAESATERERVELPEKTSHVFHGYLPGLKPGQAYTTLEIKTVFHKALRADIPVRAEGRIVQMGRRAGFAEADLRGIDGTLYATATSTCLVMERPR